MNWEETAREAAYQKYLPESEALVQQIVPLTKGQSFVRDADPFLFQGLKGFWEKHAQSLAGYAIVNTHGENVARKCVFWYAGKLYIAIFNLEDRPVATEATTDTDFGENKTQEVEKSLKNQLNLLPFLLIHKSACSIIINKRWFIGISDYFNFVYTSL
jgi:hypothetical protein